MVSIKQRLLEQKYAEAKMDAREINKAWLFAAKKALDGDMRLLRIRCQMAGMPMHPDQALSIVDNSSGDRG